MSDATTAARATQQQLFGEPSAAEMLKMAQAQPLSEKINNAIALLRLHENVALRMSPDGYYVCDSYGKDSDCIVHLAKLAGVKHKCHHNVTSIDPPELQRFGMRTRPDTIRHRQKVAMLTRLATSRGNGPPTRMARWCCAEYKEQGGKLEFKVIGVRAQESRNRALNWQSVRGNTNGIGAFCCPILYWTSADVWEFHKLHNLPYCELYDHGHKRLGCVGCPMAGKYGKKRDFARWPLYARNWHKAVIAYAEKWHGVPTLRGKRRWFEDLYDKGGAEAVWNWWLNEDTKAHSTCQYGEMFAGAETWGDDDAE
jgi:phosphoadenosine phosphosulfate reductase